LALAALRGLSKIYGSVAVLHFDAHLDTWHPAKYPSPWPSAQAQFNHGSMFWLASNEGLIVNGSSVHAGLRTVGFVFPSFNCSFLGRDEREGKREGTADEKKTEIER
jgi:arginase family enzyme